MAQLIRLLWKFCIWILLAAVAIAIFDIVALFIVDKFASRPGWFVLGCRWHTEIFPNFSCGPSLPQQAASIVLNLPLLFIYAVVFTYAFFFTSTNSSGLGTFLIIAFFVMDGILLFAIAYPVVTFIARERGRFRR